MSTEKKRAFIIDVLFIVVILAVIYLCLRYLLAWLLPFVIALIIAYASRRPICWISEKTHISRRVISVIFVLFFIGFALFFLVFLGYRMVMELSGFLSQVPTWVQNGAAMLHFSLTDWTEGLALGLPEDIAEQVSALLVNVTNSLVSEVGTLSTRAVTWLASKATAIPNIAVTFIITIIACFYISLDYESIVAFLKRQVPARYYAIASSAKNTLISGILRMGKAYLILMTITFIELGVGLTILKVEYSITIAAIIAVVDILPVLGTGTILIPWAVISALQGNYHLAVGLGILYAIITVLRNILEPRLVGKQIGLNPVVTLIMMYVGLQVLGLAGMFLFPLVLIILKAAQDAELIKIWK